MTVVGVGLCKQQTRDTREQDAREGRAEEQPTGRVRTRPAHYGIFDPSVRSVITESGPAFA